MIKSSYCSLNVSFLCVQNIFVPFFAGGYLCAHLFPSKELGVPYLYPLATGQSHSDGFLYLEESEMENTQHHGIETPKLGAKETKDVPWRNWTVRCVRGLLNKEITVSDQTTMSFLRFEVPLHLHGPWYWTLGARAKEVPAGTRGSRRIEFSSGPLSWLVGWLLHPVTSAGNRRLYELAEEDGIAVMYGLKTDFMHVTEMTTWLIQGEGS